jgi:tRNA(Ile)-lysidine synthase
LRAIDRAGHEGPAELGKVEALLQAMDCAFNAGKSSPAQVRFKQTLAGATISIDRNRVQIAAAPPRGGRSNLK